MTRDDSVMTSIQEIQRLEHERSRELARREADAKRAQEARLVAERIAAERQAQDRAAALEAQRRAEAAAAESRARADREEREAREMQLRAEAEEARELRAEARREAHARTMAEIERQARTGFRARTLAAILVGTLGLCAVGAYLFAFKPMLAAHEARISELRIRAERADRERDAARSAQAAVASRIRAVESLPAITHVQTPQSPIGSPTTRRSARPTTVRTPTAEAPIDIDATGDDIFTMDDAARAGNTHRAHR